MAIVTIHLTPPPPSLYKSSFSMTNSRLPIYLLWREVPVTYNWSVLKPECALELSECIVLTGLFKNYV